MKLAILWMAFWLAMCGVVTGVFDLTWWSLLYISVPYGLIAGVGAACIYDR